VNTLFLFLIALPLAVYLVVLLFATRDLEPATQDEDKRASELPSQDALAVEAIQLSETAAERPSARESLASESIAAPNLAPEMHVKENLSAPAALTTLASALDAERVEPRVEQEPPPQLSPPEPRAKQDSTPSTPSASELTSEPPLQAELAAADSDLILPEGPLQFPDKGSPKYAFDYRGRLWVEKKRKSFFRQLRRPQIPPEEPQS
jgi:hypothetical protein